MMAKWYPKMSSVLWGEKQPHEAPAAARGLVSAPTQNRTEGPSRKLRPKLVTIQLSQRVV